MVSARGDLKEQLRSSQKYIRGEQRYKAHKTAKPITGVRKLRSKLSIGHFLFCFFLLLLYSPFPVTFHYCSLSILLLLSSAHLFHLFYISFAQQGRKEPGPDVMHLVEMSLY